MILQLRKYGNNVQDSAYFLDTIKSILSGSITINNQTIKLGEGIKGSIDNCSYLLSQEPYDFPRINFMASGTVEVDKDDLSKIENELMTFGYKSIDELGLQWLMLPSVKGYMSNVIIDIPIYFLPLSLSLDSNSNMVKFSTICHKALVSNLAVRLNLKKQFAGKYVPVENYLLSLQPRSAEDIGEAVVIQSLECGLSRNDIVECIVTSKVGILGEKSELVEYLLQREILAGNFPKLVSQFIGLDELEALLRGDKEIKGEMRRRPTLSFQRTVAWLLSMLGFQVVELEGTNYKEIEEADRTRREADMLLYDPETERMYVVDLTLRVPKDEKIDDIANLQLSLQRKGIFVEPMIIVRDYASETKKNRRHVRIIDQEDLKTIINKLQIGNIQDAKKIITE